jgi:hypothetical protein
MLYFDHRPRGQRSVDTFKHIAPFYSNEAIECCRWEREANIERACRLYVAAYIVNVVAYHK